jgi:hypothetical protein
MAQDVLAEELLRLGTNHFWYKSVAGGLGGEDGLDGADHAVSLLHLLYLYVILLEQERVGGHDGGLQGVHSLDHVDPAPQT